jgi:formylglycine-generating enzyme required for sulfatase activity
VINVSWNDAQAYIDWLNQKTGFIYRLLSEAEWEYACRASTTTAYSTGRKISRGQARFETLLGAAGKTEEAGTFPANPFGLHDMHGNVWEWCQDCWNSTYHGAPYDGSAWATGDCGQRVLRGGSFADESRFLRSAARNRSYKENSGSSTGFRVARELS